jgi:hypothetical protein
MELILKPKQSHLTAAQFIRQSDEVEAKRIRLIRVRDGEQTDYCQRCGGKAELLFWNGTLMSCVPCDKGMNIVRKFDLQIPDKGLSYIEFRMQLDQELALLEKLDALHDIGLTERNLIAYIKHNDVSTREAIEQMYHIKVEAS